MSTIKLLIKWGGIVLGLIITVIGYVSTVNEARSWVLPANAWYGIGFLIFAISAGVIIYRLSEEKSRLNQQIQSTQNQDPLVIEAKRKHFADLSKVIQDWKNNLVTVNE